MHYLVFIAAFAFAATSALAQGVPTADDIERQLQPGAAPTLGKTRSLGAPKTRKITVEDDGKTVEKTVVTSIDLYVPFDYDSDAITDRARPVLEQLAAALKGSKLAGFNFVVAGHTDAQGSDAYNNELSQRRALSVLAYLVSSHGIEPSRLISKGFGETELKDPGNDEVNRRVEILNVGN